MIYFTTARPEFAPPVEFVERKGLGHPDTICDAVAEELCRYLARGYLERLGTVQAFNVDKAILAAGAIDIGYGGGTVQTKARLIVVGKADLTRWTPDRDELIEVVTTKLAEILPDADLSEAFDVDVWLSPSSVDLSAVVSGRDIEDVPLANDTSFAAVSLPRSPLEELVFQTETELNSAAFRSMIPVGRDVKVMGARSNGFEVTVAAPVMAEKVEGPGDYKEAVAAISAKAEEVAHRVVGEAEISVNKADNDDTPYLSLTGTSAEQGDDGQVGRGNRFGGLITPYRAMSLEAACGKNPAAHVGKTYHAAAWDIAENLVAHTGVEEATVRLLSQIGSPVTQPLAAHIEYAGEADENDMIDIAQKALADWKGIRDRLIAGDYQLY
jgi:S-adenosylmethionine synthetase